MAKRNGGFVGQDGLNAPDEPTDVSASAGDTQATVSFTSPSDEGGAAVTGYRVTDSTGTYGASGSSSPITVTGLTNGTSYTFRVWAINPFGWSQPSGVSGSVSPYLPRGVFVGGSAGSNVIDYITFAGGNATDFGDISTGSSVYGGCGSQTRGVFGAFNSINQTLEYITFASTGNSANFGSLSQRDLNSGCSNSTRGLFAGGRNTSVVVVNVISYITIATTGSSSDFGDLLLNSYGQGSTANSTRAVMAGGYDASMSNVIQYVTIATTGNATDFGDLNGARGINAAGAASSTRAIFGGGNNSSFTPVNTIEYVTIATTGNATDFGDLTIAPEEGSACSNSVLGVFAGGRPSGGVVNVICRVTIATTGNATDFGDLTVARAELASASNAHGGLA